MDVALAIEALIPAAEYGGSTTANTKTCFNALRWEDSRKKPTWMALQAAWADLEPSLPDPEQEAAIQAEVRRYDREKAMDRLGLSAEGG